MEVILEESSYKKYQDTSSNTSSNWCKLDSGFRDECLAEKRSFYYMYLGLESEYFFIIR